MCPADPCQQHGLTWFMRDPNSFTPLLNGQHLLLGRSLENNKKEIAKFSVGPSHQRGCAGNGCAEEGRCRVWRLRALYRAHGCIANLDCRSDSCAAAGAIEPLLDAAPVDLGSEGHYDQHFLRSRATVLAF